MTKLWATIKNICMAKKKVKVNDALKQHTCQVYKKNKGLKVSINQLKRYNLVEY